MDCDNELHLPYDEAAGSGYVPPRSGFTTAEYHFGADGTPVYHHERDLFYGWRCLTALGNYDSRFGGDLILWDHRLVVTFPPGSSFLFPGAMTCYSFSQVGWHENQYLMSQYAEAPHFHYHANGFSHFSRKNHRLDVNSRAEAALRTYSHINELF
ncbi:hypothetical protein C8J57DRAFT_1507617 [Mycena rebaudengoi]|nr:hypothetical protein C8J57DRAFT_1507617 [Mycena rebaudengoi]